MIQILAFVEDLKDPHHRKEQLEDLQQREEEWNVREPIKGKKKKKKALISHHRKEQFEDLQLREE